MGAVITELDVAVSIHQDFPTLRIQQPDCCEFLWELAWHRPELFCLIWVV